MPVTVASIMNKKLFLSPGILLSRRKMERHIYICAAKCYCIVISIQAVRDLGKQREWLSLSVEGREVVREKVNLLPSL